MRSPSLRGTILAACIVVGQPSAQAADSVIWTIGETIARNDNELAWTSPTAIDLGFDQYAYDYEITRILASLGLGSVDVTDLIGDSFPLLGGGTTEMLPVVLIDSALDDPTTGTTADVLIEVDSEGFGQASFTNVMLGSAPLGPVSLPIQSIRVEATITLTGTDFAPGDYNRDGAVDAADYDLWARDYGSTNLLAADGNEDGAVNAADYTVWRDNAGGSSAMAIPEPATVWQAAAAGMLLVFRRRG